MLCAGDHSGLSVFNEFEQILSKHDVSQKVAGQQQLCGVKLEGDWGDDVSSTNQILAFRFGRRGSREVQQGFAHCSFPGGHECTSREKKVQQPGIIQGVTIVEASAHRCGRVVARLHGVEL